MSEPKLDLTKHKRFGVTVLQLMAFLFVLGIVLTVIVHYFF